jgi:hypothetical protein
MHSISKTDVFPTTDREISTAPQTEPPKAAPTVFQPPPPASHPVPAQAPEEVEAAATAALLAAPPEQGDGTVVGEVKGKAPKKVWDSSRYVCEHSTHTHTQTHEYTYS